MHPSLRSLTSLLAFGLVHALSPAAAHADEPATLAPRAPAADGDYAVDKRHDRSARGREYWAWCPRTQAGRPIVDTRFGFHQEGDRAVMVSLQLDLVFLLLPLALPLLGGFVGGG